jgi:hypothetical protein
MNGRRRVIGRLDSTVTQNKEKTGNNQPLEEKKVTGFSLLFTVSTHRTACDRRIRLPSLTPYRHQIRSFKSHSKKTEMIRTFDDFHFARYVDAWGLSGKDEVTS